MPMIFTHCGFHWRGLTPIAPSLRTDVACSTSKSAPIFQEKRQIKPPGFEKLTSMESVKGRDLQEKTKRQQTYHSDSNSHSSVPSLRITITCITVDVQGLGRGRRAEASHYSTKENQTWEPDEQQNEVRTGRSNKPAIEPENGCGLRKRAKGASGAGSGAELNRFNS